ncbi:DUF3472 domain-containing protein [Deminuibacter soli]|uniref:DUF3472 domain-containing protein n=1 Tax=Deminuibacter soli TaxID=2291815 RepID=A0A3E1NP40_9BACT|nr:DUF3472 domain-containing protein [Deminuibacter soli]RFM29692.1 DUF3472 domain-containing protein [Deminuibacter soli]
MKKQATRTMLQLCSWLLFAGAVVAQSDTSAVIVPPGGNSFVTTTVKGDKAEVTGKGWENWQQSSTVFSTYIKVSRKGSLQLFATLQVPQGQSVVRCTIGKNSRTVTLKDNAAKEYALGSWDIDSAGYVKIDMQGVSKTGPVFASLLQWRIGGTAVDAQAHYVKNNEGNYFYWGRRGPSVHLGYDISEVQGNAEWFYNEITVPKDNDVIGSYYMANGFGEGYFGMQVNSATERRILFSVWSPFKTDDPAAIPEDQKIRLLKKGDGVHAGEFGNEGSGGQSYLRFNWKAGNSYKFLLHAQPGDSDRTTYTAYFFAPERNQWQLIASFSRPHTQTWLKHLHSFLENFEPETGYLTRKALYHNQWVKTSDGKWIALSKAKFTGDATAQKGYRMDYGGGTAGNAFYLHNCGFFSNNTVLNTPLVIQPGAGDGAPQIDFTQLP